MFKPHVPLLIMRDKRLAYQTKSFLLWCWICRDTDEKCGLVSCKQDCRLRERSITWYADYFGMHRQQLSTMFAQLRELGIMKIAEIDTRNEITYIDFTVFC